LIGALLAVVMIMQMVGATSVERIECELYEPFYGVPDEIKQEMLLQQIVFLRALKTQEIQIRLLVDMVILQV